MRHPRPIPPKFLSISLILALGHGALEQWRVRADDDPATSYTALRTDVETPHFDWADPPSDPSLKVLVLCDRRYARDAVELWQRSPFVLQTVPCGSWGFIRFGEPEYLTWSSSQVRSEAEAKEGSEAFLLERLMRFLREKPNVLLSGGIPWMKVPDEARRAIWRQVHAGMGLVFVLPAHPDQRKEFAEDLAVQARPAGDLSFPELALPELAGTKSQLFHVGDGMLATVSFGPLLQSNFLLPSPKNATPIEVSAAYLLKVIRRVSGRDEKAGVRSVTARSPAPWSTRGPGEMGLIVEVPDAADASVRVDVLDSDFVGLAHSEQAARLVAGRNELSLAIPAAPTGKTYLVARLKGPKGIQSYGAAVIEVQSNAKLILSTDRELFPFEGPVAGTVRLDGQEEGDRVEVGLFDVYGREVARQVLSATVSGVSFSLSDPAPQSRYQEVLARAERGRAPLARARSVIYRKLPRDLNRFHFFAWHGLWDQYWAMRQYEVERRHGQNAQLSPGFGPSYVRAGAKANLDALSITHSGKRSLQELCDPEVLRQESDKLVKSVGEIRELGGQWGMSYGDEIYVKAWERAARDVTREPVRGAFVAFLKRRYGDDLNALRQAWGQTPTTFDAVVIPPDLDVPREPRAPWLDYCLFIDDAACRYYQALTDAARKADPEVLIGMDGIEEYSGFDGIDWWRLQQMLDVMIIYPHIDHVNKTYSWRAGVDFHRPGTISGFWLAYDSDAVPEVTRLFPWRILFYQMNAVGFFQLTNVTDSMAGLYPDWHPRPAYRAASEEVRRIRQGIDRLLLTSQRTHSAIAIHYSPSSFALSFPDSGIENHINQLGVYNTHRTSRKGYVGSVSNAASAFTMILTDLGYQTKMIATAQIESGALSDYKVLVLPFSQCLTEQEITAIRAFVEGGGLLIADYRCGVRDPHGNLRQDGGTLDELFGIRQSPGNVVHQGCRVSERFGIRDKGGIWACQAIGQTVTGGPLDVRRPAEPPAPGAVQPTSLGEADDGTPVFVVNTCGKGVTLYLNFAVDSYLALRPKGLGAEFRELLEPVVSVFGQVGPPARVVRRQPGYRDFRAYVHPPEIGVEVTRFRDGTAEYVSLLWDYMRNDWGRHEVVVHFAYPAHTYDVIAGAYLGFRSEVDLNIEGCPVRLLARMPYEVLQVKIVPPASHPAAGKAVAFHVDVVAGGNATPGRHVFWTMLLDPQGRPVEGMGASVVAERGHASVSWSPAYNDPPGVYTLTCRDVTSGVEASTRISLSEVPAHPSPIQ